MPSRFSWGVAWIFESCRAGLSGVWHGSLNHAGPVSMVKRPAGAGNPILLTIDCASERRPRMSRVLVISQWHQEATGLTQILQRDGHVVEIAGTSLNAARSVREAPPDLL